MIDRRQLILSGIGSSALIGFAPKALAVPAQLDPLGKIAAQLGGRLGFAALDTGNGHRLVLDPEGRYPLCSTFKWILAAAILQKVDRKALSLDKVIKFSKFDLLEYAPVVKANLDKGALSIETLCKAAVQLSDNSAANLLLPQVGGPRGVTTFIREAGDPVTRLDRDEPTLNEFKPDDPRDTTAPYAMVLLMQSVLTGDVLTQASRDKLIDWMVGARTGLEKLRAGMPHGWRVGDKTGNSGNGQINDVAIAFPSPDRKPVLISCYIDSPGLTSDKANSAMKQLGELVGILFAQG